MKRIYVLLLSLMLLLGCAMSAQAVEIPDPNRSGSLTFLMDWEGEPLDDGSLTLYRVGDIAKDDAHYRFALVSELRSTGLSLDDLDDADLHQALAEVAPERGLDPITAPIRNGEASFENLMPGLYVVTQTEEEACDGFAPIRPFLISLPRWDGARYIYDITAEPKVSLETEPTVPTTTEPTEPTDPWLPQTGQLNWPVPAMAAAGLALCAAGWFLCFGKKERNES